MLWVYNDKYWTWVFAAGFVSLLISCIFYEVTWVYGWAAFLAFCCICPVWQYTISLRYDISVYFKMFRDSNKRGLVRQCTVDFMPLQDAAYLIVGSDYSRKLKECQPFVMYRFGDSNLVLAICEYNDKRHARLYKRGRPRKGKPPTPSQEFTVALNPRGYTEYAAWTDNGTREQTYQDRVSIWEREHFFEWETIYTFKDIERDFLFFHFGKRLLRKQEEDRAQRKKREEKEKELQLLKEALKPSEPHA